MKLTMFLLAMAAFAVPAFAIPAVADDPVPMYPRTPVSDARPLLLAAIQASNGEGQCVLTDDIAIGISQRFGAN